MKQHHTNKPVRLLPLEGAYNVRDLGGYKTIQGKQVKWHRIIRADDLHNLTESDLKLLSGIPIRSYIDFRSDEEMISAPDKTPCSLKNYFHLKIDPASIIDLKKISAAQTPKLLEDINRIFVNHCQDIFRRFFHILMNTDNIPLLFHCSAGKDRTGFAAALVLASLGVDKETIIHDYLLSATYLKGKYHVEIEKNPALEPLMTVKREYIEAAFQFINSEYGSMENYLTKNLEVDIARMQTLYTE